MSADASNSGAETIRKEKKGKREKKDKGEAVVADPKAGEHLEGVDEEDLRAQAKKERKEKRRLEKEALVQAGAGDEPVVDDSEKPKKKKKEKKSEGAAAPDAEREKKSKKEKRKRADDDGQAGEAKPAAQAVEGADEPSEPKKKKKEKKEKKAAEDQSVPIDTKPSEDEGAAEPKPKKKKEKKTEGIPTTDEINADEALADKDKAKRAIIYAQQHALFHAKRDEGISWKFKSVEQNWLVRHLWDEGSIPDRYVDLVIGYVKTIQGAGRARLIETAKSKRETSGPEAVKTDEEAEAAENPTEAATAEGDVPATDSEKVQPEPVDEEAQGKLEAAKFRAEKLLKAMGAR